MIKVQIYEVEDIWCCLVTGMALGLDWASSGFKSSFMPTKHRSDNYNEFKEVAIMKANLCAVKVYWSLLPMPGPIDLVFFRFSLRP